jgi:gluconate 2-dehydrogenase alpha chain
LPRLIPLSGFEPSTILPTVEVLIVGTGAAAMPLAKELVDTGFEVVCLERGPYQTIQSDFAPRKMFDELKIDIRKEMLPHGDDLYVTFRDDRRNVAKRSEYPMRKGVGGSNEHWGTGSWRFYEDDFELKSTVVDGLYKGIDLSAVLQNEGAAIQDWPGTYAEFEPFYEKVEYEMGVGGRAGVLSTDGTLNRSTAQTVDNRQLHNAPDTEEGGNIFEAVRHKPYPFPPLRDRQTDIVFRKAALEMGLSTFQMPSGITSRPWTSELGVERAGCSYCSFCSGYGCWNGSKTSPLSAVIPYLQEKRGFKIRPFSDAFRVNTIDAGNGLKMAKSVDYFDSNGAVVRQAAHIVVLAGYTFQNVRILLNSGIDGSFVSRDGVSVGKYFMNCVKDGGVQANIVFDKIVLNGYDGPSAAQHRTCDHFNGENFAELKLRELLPKGQFFLRGAAIAGTSGLPLQGLPNLLPPSMPKWGATYKEYVRRAFNQYLSVHFIQEPLPYEDKFVDLDPTYKDSRGIPVCRVTNPAHENERRMASFMAQKGEEILRQAARMFGGGTVWSRDLVEMVGVHTHDTGGTRMGSHPARSTTNRYGQMWQVPNLFPVGGSLFPSMSGHNPTETIWMLSSWVGSAIAQKCVDLESSGKFRQIGPEAHRRKV